MQIEHQFDEDISAFKEHMIKCVTEVTEEHGNVVPFTVALAYNAQDKRVYHEIIPVPPSLTNSDASKDFLAKVMMPAFVKKLNEYGVFIIALAFVSEAFTWSVPADNVGEAVKKARRQTKEEYDAVKAKAVKQEVVFISVETSFDCKLTTFKRVGSEGVNEKYEALGKIHLEPMDMPITIAESRFSHMLRGQPNFN